MIMSARCESTVVSLLSIAKAHQKKYCFVSQKTILKLLDKYHGWEISRRTLNRDLKWLVENGYISRLRRIRVGPDGKLLFCATLYKFTGKLFNWLYSAGNRITRFFSFFRVPKMAHHQLAQKHGISPGAASSMQEVVIKARDGTPQLYNPWTGDLTNIQ